jgi:predicted ferric reductase
MSGLALTRPSTQSGSAAARLRRVAYGYAVLAVVVANAVAIGWLWWHGGNVVGVKNTAGVFTSIGRLTGLESAYLALVQVILLARIPALERAVGFDRLTRWHRWNGHACIDLIVLHVVFIVWGYALLDKLSIGGELSTMLGGGIYPGMITATVGTAMLIAVVATSVVIVRRRLRYEWWYAVHLLAYAGIALAWFHEIPTGNELVLDRTAADYWRVLYIAALAIIVGFRVVVPLAHAFRYRLRVERVVEEGPGVVSIHLAGRGLQRLNAQPGQFFLWRFLDRRRIWSAHPFSLSAAPTENALRITVKALGDHTGRIGSVRPGTRVVAEGPLGTFTDAVRRSPKALLLAGGIGITPVRALLETMHGDIVVVYRVVAESDLVLVDELDELAAQRGATVHHVVGDHRGEGASLLSPSHLTELVPDVAERDVYLCGPAGMTAALERTIRAVNVPRSHLHVERFALT